jgi:uncharacterized protein YkwD
MARFHFQNVQTFLNTYETLLKKFGITVDLPTLKQAVEHTDVPAHTDLPEPAQPVPAPEPAPKPVPEPAPPVPETTPEPVPAPKPDPAPKPAPEPDSSSQSSATELESYFLKLVNADRAKVGADALTFDNELIDAARDHSGWMDSADTLSHTGVNGTNPGQRIDASGYDANKWAENVAYVAGSKAEVMDKGDAEQLHTNLMNSPGHRANLLDDGLTEIGIGLHQGDMKGMAAVYVTQAFGTPSASEAQEIGVLGVNSDNWQDGFGF